MLKNSNLSHYQMIRQFVKKLSQWGKATYIGFNSIDFDELGTKTSWGLKFNGF